MNKKKLILDKKLLFLNYYNYKKNHITISLNLF